MTGCARCGHENLEGELFCAACQQRLPRAAAETYAAMYREQEAKWRARRRSDARFAVAWGVAIGLAVLAISFWMEATGGDPGLIALGKQAFWLVGILWGLGAWGLRRVSPLER